MKTNYVYWIRGADFSELAGLSIASVRRVDPQAHVHIWTDDPKNTPKPHGSDSYHSLPGGRPAMVANLDAQIAALNYCPRGERVLFLDADTLLLKPFEWSLFPKMFVTWRAEVNGDREAAILQPYNYGVLGVWNGPEVLEAFYWMRARILQMNSRNQAWYGNQLALAELVGSPPQDGTADKEVRVKWSLNDEGSPLTIRQLPCALFNYSPNAEGEDVSARRILHMKGGRKDLMKHYAVAA